MVLINALLLPHTLGGINKRPGCLLGCLQYPFSEIKIPTSMHVEDLLVSTAEILLVGSSTFASELQRH